MTAYRIRLAGAGRSLSIGHFFQPGTFSHSFTGHNPSTYQHRVLSLKVAMDELSCHPVSAGAGQDALTAIMQRLELKDRFKCALVCRAWADAAAAAATRSINQKGSFDVSSLQQWLEKHGSQVEVLHLDLYSQTALTALPCPKLPCPVLRDLELLVRADKHVAIGCGAWSDIAAATQLTSVSLSWIDTPFQPEAASALTALPHLKQLSWRSLHSGVKENLQTDLCDVSALLQHQTQLTKLELQGVTAEALQHLGSLSKLQHLSIKRASVTAEIHPTAPQEWDEGSLPDLPVLSALTSLEWDCSEDIPGSLYQLTALRRLKVCEATATALDGLQVMPGLSHLCVRNIYDLPEPSATPPAPWQLPALQHLELTTRGLNVFNMALLACCTQLQDISLQCMGLGGSVSMLGSSSILQRLGLWNCHPHAATWREFFLQGSAQLPQLTMLQLQVQGSIMMRDAVVRPADLEFVAACCPGLKELALAHAAGAPELTQLPHLTCLHLHAIHPKQCNSLAQLTGLRKLRIFDIKRLTVAGLRELAVLQQLTYLSMGSFLSSRLSEAVKRRLTDTVSGSMPLIFDVTVVNKVRPVRGNC